MDYGIAIAFIAGGFLSLLLMWLMRDKCKHEWEFVRNYRLYRNQTDTRHTDSGNVYQCTKCLESKRVEV